MFTTSRSKSHRESFTHRAGKSTSKKQRSFKEYHPTTKKIITHHLGHSSPSQASPTSKASSSSPSSPYAFSCHPHGVHTLTHSSTLNSAIVTICVGPEQRLFAAHEEILTKSPYFHQICRAQFFEPSTKRVELPNEAPEVFSAVLEYLYKGDYTPNINYDKKRGTWYLEDSDALEGKDYTIQCANGTSVLKDTVIYLFELQRLALKKQGLASNVQCSTILSSARFAYANTPPSDSKLRAHYLALIIRSRNTFKRSGTMQMEMQAGGTTLFFDLFVAMVNHLEDLSSSRSPRV